MTDSVSVDLIDLLFMAVASALKITYLTCSFKASKNQDVRNKQYENAKKKNLAYTYFAPKVFTPAAMQICDSMLQYVNL